VNALRHRITLVKFKGGPLRARIAAAPELLRRRSVCRAVMGGSLLLWLLLAVAEPAFQGQPYPAWNHSAVIAIAALTCPALLILVVMLRNDWGRTRGKRASKGRSSSEPPARHLEPAAAALVLGLSLALAVLTVIRTLEGPVAAEPAAGAAHPVPTRRATPAPAPGNPPAMGAKP
jgi:hypothetical protein